VEEEAILERVWLECHNRFPELYADDSKVGTAWSENKKNKKEKKDERRDRMKARAEWC